MRLARGEPEPEGEGETLSVGDAEGDAEGLGVALPVETAVALAVSVATRLPVAITVQVLDMVPLEVTLGEDVVAALHVGEFEAEGQEDALGVRVAAAGEGDCVCEADTVTVTVVVAVKEACEDTLARDEGDASDEVDTEGLAETEGVAPEEDVMEGAELSEGEDVEERVCSTLAVALGDGVAEPVKPPRLSPLGDCEGVLESESCEGVGAELPVRADEVVDEGDAVEEGDTELVAVALPSRDGDENCDAEALEERVALFVTVDTAVADDVDVAAADAVLTALAVSSATVPVTVDVGVEDTEPLKVDTELSLTLCV